MNNGRSTKRVIMAALSSPVVVVRVAGAVVKRSAISEVLYTVKCYNAS